MVATGTPLQNPAQDYSFREHVLHRDSSTVKVKGHLWDSMESGTVSHLYGSGFRTTHASRGFSQSPSPKLQDSLQCYTRRVSEPVQPADPMAYPYGHYPGRYSSRASSTLPSPSPMTPNTDDTLDLWPSKRQPPGFASSSVSSLFSPKSPTDYDFPTGAHLPPLMNGSQEPIPRADIFPEGFSTYQAGCYFKQGSRTLDAKSSCLPMNGPPYPPQILDQNGEIYRHFDPHDFNMGVPGAAFATPEEAYTIPKETYTTPEELLNMNYGAELEVPVPHGFPLNALTPTQEDEYINAEDHANPYAVHSPLEEAQEALPLSGGIQPSEPADHLNAHQPESAQRALGRRPSHQIKANPKATNQCHTCNKAHDSQIKLRKHIRKEHVRPYPCIFTHYGCNSVFGTKNEWSRHVKVQHLRLETWKCNIVECGQYVNDEDRTLLTSASKGKYEYDRKDLFLNHVRRCHKDQYPERGVIEGTRAMAYEDQVQNECHIILRVPPTNTLCHCCPGIVWTDFDARLEHIGRAMEAHEEARVAFHDRNLETYMRNEHLLQWRDSNGWLLTGAEGKKGGRQAKRGTHQRPLTIQVPLTAADEEHETPIQPSRKSKRVELKKKKQQQQQQLSQQLIKREEPNSDDDAEADDDDEYQGNN